MTILDQIHILQITSAARVDAELGINQRDAQIDRVLASEGRVDPSVRDHDRALVQRSLAGIRTELEEDVARVDETLAGRSSRSSNLAIAALAAVEALGWLQVGAMLDLSGASRLVFAVGLAGIFVEFSRRAVGANTAAPDNRTSTKKPSLLDQLGNAIATTGTRALYTLVVLCVVALKISDAVEDGEPWIRVFPQGLLLAVACVGPALLIESVFAKSQDVRVLESKKKGLLTRIRVENARIKPAEKEIEKRHRKVAHDASLTVRLRAAYDLEHARITAMKRANDLI